MLAMVALSTSGAWADDMPEPLTYEFALTRAESPDHPDVLTAQSQIQAARAEQDSAGAASDLEAAVVANGRWVGPSAISQEDVNEDHIFSFSMRKRLYDFGRTRHAEKAAQQELNGSRQLLWNTLQERRLQIMRAYFDVILADMRYHVDFEDMSVAYVQFDRMRERNKLGQVSDLDLLKQETVYQSVRRRYTEAQTLQRSTRARLANAMNMPGSLPATVTPPTFSDLSKKPLDYEELLQQARANNPVIMAYSARVGAAQQRLASARSAYWPILSGELEAAEYERQVGLREDWRASVVLTLPLYQGGRVSGQVGRQQAELYRMQAELQRQQRNIEQNLLDTWLILGTLRVQLEQMKTLSDYRELYLDNARALYDWQQKADLGDAMARQTEARLQTMQTEFELAMAWAKLDALVGTLVSQEKVK